MVTDVSTTRAEVIIRVKWKIVVSWMYLGLRTKYIRLTTTRIQTIYNIEWINKWVIHICSMSVWHWLSNYVRNWHWLSSNKWILTSCLLICHELSVHKKNNHFLSDMLLKGLYSFRKSVTVVSDCHFHLDNQSRSHYKSKDHTKSDKDVDKISCTMVLLSLLPFLGTSISKLDHKWFNATYRLWQAKHIMLLKRVH